MLPRYQAEVSEPGVFLCSNSTSPLQRAPAPAPLPGCKHKVGIFTSKSVSGGGHMSVLSSEMQD